VRGEKFPATATLSIGAFDPGGETTTLLTRLGFRTEPVKAGDDLSRYDILIVGKSALTVGGPAPDIQRVREGVKVIVFEQTSEVLENDSDSAWLSTA